MKSKTVCENALRDSGFSTQLEYIQPNKHQEKKSKEIERGMLSGLIPPILKNVKTNIGKIFFHLINKHFPKLNKLHKTFHRNTIKISYSCMKNLNSIISSHNTSLLKKPEQESRLCNAVMRPTVLCKENAQHLTSSTKPL